MKYTRKFEKRNPTGRAAGTGRTDSRTLARKILSAVTALSVIGNPFATLAASVVTRYDKPNDNIMTGNVGNIYAETVKNDVAVNRFDKFQIGAGDIANMYFQTQGSSQWAGSLVNFVNNRIDVAGTVNAIKDNQIGGNLYFLSASGMAVTGSGVINAGSLFVMTPTQDFMDSMLKKDVTTDAFFSTNTGMDTLNAITRANDAESWAVIPINPSGTITVLGKINAVDHVEMRAAHIGIGKNISGEDLKNSDDSVLIAKDAMNTAAAITTGVTDFADLVNLNSSQLSAAKITSLTATRSTDGGDIILTAYNDGSGTEISSPVFEDTINEGKDTFKRQDFVVSVENYGTIKAAGGVDITAHAVNANADTNGQSTTNKSAAQLASVSASVVIDGAVTAKDDVNVSAAAENRYVDNTGLFTKYAGSGVSFVMPVVGDVAYSALKTNADVTVGTSGSLTSSGGSVNVSAKADTLAASEASALGLRYGSMFPGGNQNNVPAAATVYTEAENTASVTVNGNVTANKDVSITADGKLTIDAANKMRVEGNKENANDIAIAVTVARADNNASVTIDGGETAEKKNIVKADGALTVNAKADSDFASSVEVDTGNEGALAAAINVAQFSSAANLAVDNADLTAGGALTAAAENTIAGDSVTTENGVGLGSWANSAFNVTAAKGISDLDPISTKMTDLFKSTKKGNDVENAGENDELLKSFDMTEYFKGGASITYSDQTHDSHVTIGSGASMTAGGDLAVSAATAIEDVHMTALGATSSYDDDSSTEAVINASVLVSDMSNSAKVTVEGGEGEAGATLEGGKNVRVTSDVTMDYNRIDKMVSDITTAVGQLKANMEKLPGDLKGDAQTLVDNIKGKVESLEAVVEALKGKDETLLTEQDGENSASSKISQAWDIFSALNDLNSQINDYNGEAAADIKNAFSNLTDIVTGALAFGDANSYANFAAASSAKSSSGSDMTVNGKNPTAGNGAGSVILNTVNTASVVDVGPGAAITANETAEISADSLVKDVTLGGLGTTGFNNSGGKTASVGATVNYSEFNNDTAAVVGAGTAVTAGHIDVSAANELNHVSVAGSAGMGAANSTHTKGFTVNGMVTVVEGGSRVLALVDDGAKLTANQNAYTEDDEKKTTDGGVSITSRNDAGVVNVAAGLTIGSGTASVGAALAIAGYDVKNTAGIDDVKSADDGDIISSDLLSRDHAAADGGGSVSAYGLTIDAATGGSIQSVAAGVSISKNDNSGEAGFFDNANKFYTNTMDKIVGEQSVLNTLGDKVFGSGTSLSDVANAGEVTHGSSLDQIDMGAANNYMPSFSLAGVGSVAVNTIDASTKAVADHANVTIQTPAGEEKGNVNVTARDASYVGAYAGSAAGQWKSGSTETADGRASSAAVAGAAAVNDMSNTLSAVVSNSTVANAGEVNTMALSGSQQLALGLGLTGVKSEGDSTSVGASISVNLIDHDVEALHKDNTVTAADSVNVTAYARDIESTGGGVLNIALPGGGRQGAVGANIGVAMLENNISAGIEGGSYEVEDGVQVSALNALKNITVGASAGVTTGNDKSFAVEGTGVYNEVTNETHAYIRGSEGKEASITTGAEGSVAIAANDTAVDEDSVPESVLTDGLADQTGSIQARMGDMVDLSGAKYMNETGDSVVSGDDTITISKGSGSSIVTVAASVSGSTSGAAGGAAVAITKVENDFHAEADYADITAKDVDVSAGSDTNIVNVAAGVGGGGKLAGAASVSWNDVTNTAEAAITHSVVKAQSAAAGAVNTAHIVSVTGQLAASKQTAVGAGIGYVDLDNSTQANISDTTLEKRDSDDGITVKADAANSSSSYNIGVNVSVAGKTAINGTVAVTRTQGTSGAVMDGVTITDAKRVSAAAADQTDILSVIGTISGSGQNSIGAGVAYTDIGGSSTDTDKGQRVTAAIRDSAITTADTAEDGGPQISVKARDAAKVTSIAVGAGGAGTVAVQGASAATLINKSASAEMTGTAIDETDGTKSSDVTVSADNQSEITSSASVIAIGGTAGVGAGIAVNRIVQETNASLNGGVVNAGNVTVSAHGAPRIENIGIGGGVAGTAGVSGSVAVNMIQNDTAAHIGGGAQITADGSVGVIATSDEQIASYAGVAGIAATGASVGVSVTVNDIEGTTSATVGDDGEDNRTAITAGGNDSLTTDTKIDDSTINDELIQRESVDIDSHIKRGEETRSGLIVDASSTRDMKSFLMTIGVAGEGAGVAGTVNVNQTNGATTAAMTNTTVNGGADGTAGDKADVYVNAGDYTNSAGFVGSAGVAGTGAGVGMASDTNTVSRTTTAEVTGSDIRAHDFDLAAQSAQGISSLGLGAAVAGVGGGAAGVVTVTDLSAATRAKLADSTVHADTVSVTADHTGIVNAGNVTAGAAGVGVGMGLSVGVMKDNTVTEALVGNEDAKETTTEIKAAEDVTISAENTTTANPMLSSTGAGAIAGVVGATSVNNLNSTVRTGITGAAVSAGGSLAASAKNTFNVKAYLGSQAGGAAGVGAGVTVNTIDSTVQTNVNGSTLSADKDVSLTAEEVRNIEQTATNATLGGAALGANIAVTTVGQEITDADTKAKVEEANHVYTNRDSQADESGSLFNGAAGALNSAGIKDYAPSVNAGFGGGKDSQITVNMAGSVVSAGHDFNASARENDNIRMTLGGGAAGGIAAGAGVGILNVHRNVGVNITENSAAAAKNKVDVGTDITGSANLDVYQGSAGLISGNAAVGEVSTTGTSGVVLGGTTLHANEVSVHAADHSNTSVNALGITVGAIAAGAIVAEAENTGSTSVTMTGVTVEGEETDGTPAASADTLIVTAEKANTVDAHATGGAAGLASGQGVVATASDSGTVSVTLGAEKVNGSVQGKNLLHADNMSFSGLNSPAVKAVADSVAIGLAGTANMALAKASASGSSVVAVHDGNILDGASVSISGKAGAQEGRNTAETKAEGNSGGGYAAVGNNTAQADVNMEVDVSVGDVDYRTEEERTLVGYKDVGTGESGERTPVYDTITRGVTALTVEGLNTAKAAADARSVTVAGFFTSGNNQAMTSNTSKTGVTLDAGESGTYLSGLAVRAIGTGDNTATADGSGGALVSGDLAAYVKNEMAADTSVTIGGVMQVAGGVTVEARQNDTANLNADALKAAVVGASATKAENSITGTTSVTLDGAEITGGGAFDVTAANAVTFGDKEKYAVEGSGYGGVNVQGAQFDSAIEKNAAIAVNGSRITTAGAQTYEAKTEGNITAGGYIKAAGLGAFTWVDVNHALTANDSVSVDETSALKTTEAGQDIVLAAVDNLDVAVTGVADTQGGAAGGASSDVWNRLDRTNTVDVDGSLYSMNDVNLYAGKDKNGSEGRLSLEADSESYNKTALGVAKPKLDDAVTQANQVTVGGSGSVSSVRHINAYADAGKETIRDTSVLYSWYWSDKDEGYTSSTVGDKEPDNKTSANFVTVDGSLAAGVQNKQYVTIGGDGQLVFLDDAVRDAVNAYGQGQSAVGKDDLVIEASDGVDTDSIVVGSFDYGTALFERYNELGELMLEYGEKEDSTAYLGYKAEQERILAQMEALGLVETITPEAGKGDPYRRPVEGVSIDYIELPDIIASGGNINIQSDGLGGSGSLAANGAPEVVINNNTNLYLKVNDVTVGEEGGEIHFNNTALTGDNYRETIAGLNGSGAPEVNFSQVSADAESGAGGTLTINGNYRGSPVYANVTIDGKQQTIQTTPRADIEINGLVNSENGTVSITSAANNIVIQGKTASDSAGVKGKVVSLSAASGSVSQGFQEGIVSISDVQSQYKDQYEDIIGELNEKYKDAISGTASEGSKVENVHTIETGEGVKSEGNRIAGESIYINAADININGKVQSGYGEYIVTIDSSVQSAIDQIQKNWEASGGGALSDTMVTTGTAYRIVKEEDVYNADTGAYDRQLDVYYNPYTQQIIVPDVDAHGGQVYLTGRISSTGGGSIKVLDGAYDITVKNDTATDLQLGKLVSNNADGLIRITDTYANTITDFTRDKTVTQVWDADTHQYVTSESGASSSYQPEEGLRYNWTTGTNTATTAKYEKTIKAGLWGAVDVNNETFLKEYTNETTMVESDSDTTNKKNGEYIGKVEGLTEEESNSIEDKDFVVIFDNTVVNQETAGPGKPKTWSTGFLGWFKWEQYTWKIISGTTQQYVGSVRADNLIDIGFFGNADGSSTISVNSAGNVNLMNNIASASEGFGSTIGITSGGAIHQKSGFLVGDNISLSAVSGINDVSIMSIGDTVQLDARNTGSGNISIDVSGAYGKEGHVQLTSVTAGGVNAPAGNVSLTASGDITQSGTGTSVTGHRIDLVSENGAIGTDTQALVVYGGQSVVDGTDSLSASVNAQAQGNIFLTQADGDMRIGRVYSDSGDVTVTVSNGSLYDALPSGESIDRGDTEALIQKWKDLGLIEGDGVYTEKQAQDVADYKASVQAEFETYTQLKTFYEAFGDTIPDEYAQNYESYQQLAAIYGGYESADAYLNGEKAQAHMAELQAAGAGWSQDQLLYAISDAIINPESSATDNVVKDPNLKGRNITLNVSGGVGRNSEDTTTIQLAGLGSRIDDLKTLANADAASVTWKADEGVAVINEKTPIGVQTTGNGSLTVNAKGNVYLAGRTENAEAVENILNVDTVQGGNIRLQGHDGIYNVHTGTDAAITGSSLLIQAGDGSIGTADKAMTTAVTGSVQATAGEGIYLEQVGSDALQIYSMGAGGDIVLTAKNADIVSTDTPVSSDEEDTEEGGSTPAAGYIRSDSGVITVTAGGSAGTEEHALRILNAADDSTTHLVNITAKDANVQGISTNITPDAPAEGTLFLGEIKTAGGFTADSNGSIQLGREDAEGSISTTDGDVTLAAAKDIDLDNGSITAADGSGTVDLTARGGSVTQSEDAAGIHAGAVNISTTGSQILASAENVISRFAAEGLGEAGSINGSIDFVSAAENVSVTFGDETNKGITVHDGGIIVTHHSGTGNPGSLTITGSAATTETEEPVDASIAFTSTGGITNDGTLTSADAVTMTAQGDITQKGDVTAADDASFTTTGGAISLGGSVTSTGGNVTADTEDGAITITGKADAAKDITLRSGDGAITVTGGAEAGENFSATTAGGDVTIGTEDGEGSVTAGTGDVTVTTGSGDVTVHGTSTAGKGFTATTGSGDITLKGDVTTGTDDVSASTGSGDITIGGVITSGKDVTADTENGNITFEEAVHADKGRITANAGGDGSIRVTDDLSALRDISLAVNDGGILFEGSEPDKHEEIRITSTSGDITVTAAGAKNIMDTNGEGETGDWAIFTASGEGGEGGNITVRHDGTGDIDLYELTAKNDARVYAAGKDGTGGNIHIVNLNGDLVAIVTKNPDAKMQVEHMTAASRIELTGSDINLDTIRQREDGDGFLVLDLEASDPAQPITSLIIRDLGSHVGTRFEQLWLKDGFIHSSSGALHFDKLFVEDLFTAETPYMKTDVWGAPPVLDPSKDTIYWIDTSKNRPSVSLDDWYDPSVDGGWMYLHFDGAAPLQDSNGHLLYGKNGSEVYSRRHSLVEWMNRFQDRDFYDGERAAETLLSYHDRYGLISGGGAAAENADESEITVE